MSHAWSNTCGLIDSAPDHPLPLTTFCFFFVLFLFLFFCFFWSSIRDYGDVAGGLGLSLDHSASFTTTHVAVRSRVEDAPLRPEMQSSLHAVPPVRPRQGSLSAVAPSLAGSAQAATASPSRQSLDFRRGSMGSTRADPQTAVSVTPPVATRPAAVSAAGVAQPRVLGAHAHQHAYQQQRVQQREEQLRRVTAALHRVAPRTPSANGGPKDPQYV
jgi:hypothetical protein